LDYFLSLINYKITTCYELFFDFTSYYYNAGFYIAVGTLVICLLEMLFFIFKGMKSINKLIFKNAPNKKKLREAMKEQLSKRKELLKKEKRTNFPPKKKIISKSITIDSKEDLYMAKKNKKPLN